MACLGDRPVFLRSGIEVLVLNNATAVLLTDGKCAVGAERVADKDLIHPYDALDTVTNHIGAVTCWNKRSNWRAFNR